MKILKWSGIAIAVILTILIAVIAIFYFITVQHENQTYDIDVSPLSYQFEDDEEMYLTGRHVATIRGCVDCHGENLGGDIFIEDPAVGLLVATNLTSGPGGIGAEYTDEDFIRAIRHGVRKDGKSVIFMPSHEYNSIDERDLTALLGYIRSLDPVDSNHLPETKIGFPFRMIYMLSGGELHLFPARLIDHSKPVPPAEEERTPIEVGQYVAATCVGCHGANFGGGKIPGVPPDWPEASNITIGGALADYQTDEDFFKVMREGIAPDGRQLNPEYMPWTVFGQMTDEELSGLLEYLKSLPPRETGTR